MKKETEDVVRSSIKKFFADIPQVSKYKVGKIVKAEIEEPCSWKAGDEYDNSKDACIRRYYENIGRGNVLVNWVSHLHARYNIYKSGRVWIDARSRK